MDVYEKRQLGSGHFLITEWHNNMGVNIGLVIGSQKSAVIDSGFGVTDTLRSFIEEITDKPLICIVTHAHPDHAGAAALFDEIYMNERDAPLLETALSAERRMGDVFGHGDIDNEFYSHCQEHIVDGSRFTYTNLDEGDTIQLGDCLLEVFAVPGHTQGSLVIFNRAGNYAFTSDAFAKRTALVTLPPEKRIGLISYRDGIACLLSEIYPDTRLYSGHSQETLPHFLLEDMHKACTEVLDGITENDLPSKSPFSMRPSAKAKKMMEHICGSVVLVYDALVI